MIYEFDHLDGGMSRSMLDEILMLRDSFQIIVIAPFSKNLFEYFIENQIQYLYNKNISWVVSFSKPFRSLLNCLRIQSLIKKNLISSDIIIVNGILTEFICGLMGRLKRFQRIYFVRGEVGKSKLWNMMSFKGLFCVVCVSNYVKSNFNNKFPSFDRPITIIHNFTIINPGSIKKRFNKNEFVIGCVGFIHPDKNQKMIIEHRFSQEVNS